MPIREARRRARGPLRVYRLGEAEAANAAAALDLPLRLTRRGRVVYAAKAATGSW